jgi:alkylation response protein AidB-like acyl-CoA dehydrogenase
MLSVSSDRISPAVELAELAATHAEQSERDRRLHEDVVAALRRHGLASMAVPHRLGGTEPAVSEILEMIRVVATGDGSAGWIAMIAATSSVMAHYLEEPVQDEVYQEGPATFTAGVLAPRGTAQREGDGYVLAGRWPFASGCLHASWISLGAKVGEEETANLLVPMDSVKVVDTWDVVGLRATGSHDVVVEEVFVPAGRVFSLQGAARTAEAPAQFPIYGLLAAGIAAVTLGVARAAIDCLTAAAEGKVPTGSRRKLVERPAVQEAIARAEAHTGAAWAHLMAAAAAATSFPATIGERAVLRLAATHGVESARQAVDLMYTAGGGTAIYRDSALQRQLRDVHTATQHMMVAQPTWELVGKVFCGLDADVSQL